MDHPNHTRESADRSDWKIIDTPVSASVVSASVVSVEERQSNPRTSHKSSEIVAVCPQGHFCVMDPKNIQMCDICKILKDRPGFQCSVKKYRMGRKTFELTCVKGHRILISSYGKQIDICPACAIENHYLTDSQKIVVSADCTYVNQHSRLRATCNTCIKDFYVTYAQHKIDFGVITGRPHRKARPKHCLCSFDHWPLDGWQKIVFSTLRIFEAIFECTFDDNDSMVAADNGILSGIYFTGYNRKLKIAFIHSLDKLCIKSDIEEKYAQQNGIRLLKFDFDNTVGEDGMILRICLGIVRHNIPTRFDARTSTIIGDSPTSAKYHKAKELCMLILLEKERRGIQLTAHGKKAVI